jgi:hypothetical protein
MSFILMVHGQLWEVDRYTGLPPVLLRYSMKGFAFLTRLGEQILREHKTSSGEE